MLQQRHVGRVITADAASPVHLKDAHTQEASPTTPKSTRAHAAERAQPDTTAVGQKRAVGDASDAHWLAEVARVAFVENGVDEVRRVFSILFLFFCMGIASVSMHSTFNRILHQKPTSVCNFGDFLHGKRRFRRTRDTHARAYFGNEEQLVPSVRCRVCSRVHQSASTQCV